MKRKFSIYHFLIAVMMLTVIMPAFAGAATVEGPTGSLTIHKFEQEPGERENPAGDGSAGQIAEGEAVKDVEYTLIQTHSYDPSTDKWTEVTGATPAKYTTDASGQIVIDPIELGRYSVQETGWPDHIVPDTRLYHVDIPMTNKAGTDVNYDVHIYPKNETIRGGATLTKYANDSEETLDGVKFQVFHKNGEPVMIDDEPIIMETEHGTVTVEGLPYGEYYFQEIESVEGYLLNGEKVPFKVSSQSDAIEVELQNYSKPEVEKQVSEPAVNRGDTVTYTITVELPKDIASYDSFTITDTLHANLEYVDGSQQGATGFDFAQNGQELTWTANDQVAPGTVTITFDAVISEDAVANESINNEATIDYNNGYVTDSHKDNVEVYVHAGKLTVIKQDGNDNSVKLSGAEFELRDASGALVATGTSGTDGIVVFDPAVDELPYGDYMLTETKAPADYNLLRNPIDVTIGADDNHDVTITVDNYKSGWELPKTGGIGTMLFTFIGLSLMGTASVMFLRRRNGESA